MLRKKFRAPGENRTQDPPSSFSDALNTELLEQGRHFIITTPVIEDSKPFPSRRIFIYIFCLIGIILSLSDEANKMKFLNIKRAY